MIRQTCAWMIAGVMVAGGAAPAFAQGTTTAPAQTAPAPAPAPAPAAKPAAKHAPKMAKLKHSTGMVKSASEDSLVLTVGKAKKEMTFVLDKETKLHKSGKVIEAKDLAENDTATVGYAESDGKMMAKTVTVRVPKAAAKPAAKKPQS